MVEERLVEFTLARNLFKWPNDDPGRPHINQQEADALVFRQRIVGARKQNAPLGILREASPDLLAVYNKMVAVTDSLAAHRCEVGARVRFRKTLAPHFFAGNDLRQIALTLRFVSVMKKCGGHKVAADDVQALGRISSRHFFGKYGLLD